MKNIHLCLVGFGNVGRAFARLLLNKEKELGSQYGWQFRVTGVATARHGAAINPGGINLQQALVLYERGEDLQRLSKMTVGKTMQDFIRDCPADVMFENTPVNFWNGQPAISHIRTALEKGMHAVTANKGPAAYAFRDLTALAKSKDRHFLFESAVMDSAPIFSLFRGSFATVEVRGLYGILNSTTNFILERMETGETLDEAVRQAQAMGMAEADPASDIDGWDAAVKLAVLANVIMDRQLTPHQVEREGIRLVTPEMISSARLNGERWKLVCSARINGASIIGKVQPQRVTPDSSLYNINGTSSYVEFEMDSLPGLGILERNPGMEATAQGLLDDLVTALDGRG